MRILLRYTWCKSWGIFFVFPCTFFFFARRSGVEGFSFQPVRTWCVWIKIVFGFGKMWRKAEAVSVVASKKYG